MKSNPILEEIWRIKAQLAREAGNDMHTFCEQLMEWSNSHPHPGPIIRNAEDLRRLVEEAERERDQRSALALKKKSPNYGHQ